ncbi:MAG: 2-isopropylmalate synthase [Desulforhabdus sp.]|jgi:2-isopropylmalate synthase|nr:2-isopropylmalate synthase [Desulforhabdus sp.]
MGNIQVFDTTLRDGIKSPGTILTIEEKLRIAKQLARLRVDVLELGFPAASEEEYEAVQRIAKEVRGPIMAVLARATNARDFEIASTALKDADRKRIHTFVPVSQEYRQHFLKKDAAQALELAVAAIKTAKGIAPDVEFSLVDAFRAKPEEVIQLIRAAIRAGATTLNLADTVGYTTPRDVSHLFDRLKNEIAEFDKVSFSVHCHNDLGLAVANSLAALIAGAKQMHCTVNGIGERAGNTALEEVVAAINTHAADYGWTTQIQLDQIYASSRLVSRLTGVALQPHKPIVGSHAFVCETVVPQLADSEEKPPYEIMAPENFGICLSGDSLTVHTSLEQFQSRVSELGFELSKESLQKCYEDFQDLANKKELVFDADLESLIGAKVAMEKLRYKLHYLNVTAGSISVPNATVQLEVDGQIVQDAGFGHGPVDAAFKTICKMVKRSPRLVRYEVSAVTPGTDAQGEVTLRLEENDHLVNGRAVGTDIVLASARALIDGLNKLESVRGRTAISEFTDEESWTPKL